MAERTAFEIQMKELRDRVKGLMPTGINQSAATKGYAQAIRDVMKIITEEKNAVANRGEVHHAHRHYNAEFYSDSVK